MRKAVAADLAAICGPRAATEAPAGEDGKQEEDTRDEAKADARLAPFRDARDLVERLLPYHMLDYHLSPQPLPETNEGGDGEPCFCICVG